MAIPSNITPYLICSLLISFYSWNLNSTSIAEKDHGRLSNKDMMQNKFLKKKKTEFNLYYIP